MEAQLSAWSAILEKKVHVQNLLQYAKEHTEWPKEKCGLIIPKFSFFDINSISDYPQVLNSNPSSMKLSGTKSWHGDVSHAQANEVMDQFKYIRVLEEMIFPYSKE